MSNKYFLFYGGVAIHDGLLTGYLHIDIDVFDVLSACVNTRTRYIESAAKWVHAFEVVMGLKAQTQVAGGLTCHGGYRYALTSRSLDCAHLVVS